MSWAIRYLDSDSFVLEKDSLEFLTGILGGQNKRAISQFSAQRVLLGSLHWSMGNKPLAKQYWMDGGADSSFFINKVRDIAREESLDYIDRAIFLSPTRSELLYYKGLYHEANGDGKTAGHLYEMAEMHDNWVDSALGFDVLYRRGALLFEQQRWEECRKVLLMAEELSADEAVDDTTSVAKVHRWLGILYQQQGNTQTARAHFSQSIELNPEDFWNYLSLGLIAEAEMQPPEIAFRYFDQARTAAPSALYAYVYPAQHYLGLNQLNQWRYFCEQTPWYLRHEPQWLEVCQPTP